MIEKNYDKKDWQRSEGKFRTHGRESQEKEKSLSAYYPAEWENTKSHRPNEMLTMESSYGGISFGANKQKKMTMVVHEKRSSSGPGLKKDNQKVDGNRKASISELRGDFSTNSHSRLDSAFIYEEKLSESPLRMMERLQEMMDENHQRSGEKVLPFLNRKENQKRDKEIEEHQRSSQEEGDRNEYALWNRHRDRFEREKSEQAQMYKRFFRELSFAREKSRKLMHKDMSQNVYWTEASRQETEDGIQENPSEEISDI